MSELMVRARGLTRVYPSGDRRIVAVNHIDLDIPQGSLAVLKGESGSGKSTLLSLLAGLDQASEGSLHVHGRDLTAASPAELTRYRRRVVGMVFQSFNLLPTLSVLENVILPALLAGTGSAEASARGLSLLDWLQLGGRANHFPGQLSGGEMQRTAIARALINQPAIVLADEPTGNLDSQNGERVIALLAERNRKQGETVVIATHSRIADPVANLQLRLWDGSLVQP
jgi:putative ABC transport system ATP-binding protein